MKIDPYKHKERFLKWKEKVGENGISGISKTNSDLILRYIHDMEHGLNISFKSTKGCRSYTRLNTLKEKMIFFAKKFREIYDLDDITAISEENLVLFFSRMRKGEITRRDGKNYLSTNYFVRIFKAFWHWHQKVNKKNGDEILDITEDLDARSEKPDWVYLTEEQVRELCRKAKYEYEVLIMFLFDTGIRSPGELVNIRVADLYSDFKELHIRDEISKTFGRRIKLMICPELLKEYVKSKDLSNEDYLFPINPPTVNKYLQRLALRVLGDKKSLAGQKYSELTMYDFRHCSCCYWLPRYKSESALKYRFGWKKSDKIHYYSELLGMKDTISEDDMFIDTTKTEMEQKIEKSHRENEMLKERINSMEEQMKEILGLVRGLGEKVRQ
ncbi:MAG: tyrosine-type recombinase/integrase [Nanoarchaeota archaeon]|nr:tyrosine-type recombinase/integrase [Nanoarchaeota archaeon]